VEQSGGVDTKLAQKETGARLDSGQNLAISIALRLAQTLSSFLPALLHAR